MTGPPTQGRVLACFGRVWDLCTDAGDVLAVGWHGLPDGPFNILLDHKPGSALPAGTRFVISDRCIRFAGPAEPIVVAGAPCWNPYPAWTSLAANYDRITHNLPTLASVVVAEAPAGSLVDLVRKTAMRSTPAPDVRLVTGGSALGTPPAETDYMARAAGSVETILAACNACDATALDAAVAGICGLGPGLTPAGDDWLAGWLLGLRLTESAAGLGVDVPGLPTAVPSAIEPYSSRLGLARSAVRAALSSTTILSRAFLLCACEGEVDAAWEVLLHALAYGVNKEVKPAARTILAYGATSGADMLAGFLATTYFNQEGYRA